MKRKKSYSTLASEARSKCLKLVDAIIQKRITNRSLQEQINLQKTCLVRKKATYNEHRLAYKTLREMDMDYMWTTFYTEADIILAQDPLQVCLCPKTLSWMEPEKEYHLTARVRATDTPLSVTVDGVIEKKIILEDPYQTLEVPARPEVKINKEFDDFLFLTVKKNAEYGLEVIKAEPSNAKYRKFKRPLLSDFATSPVCEKSEFFKQRDKLKNKLYRQSIVRFDLRKYAEKLGICNPVAAGAWQGLQYCGENFDNFKYIDGSWRKLFNEAMDVYRAAVKGKSYKGWNGAKVVSPLLTQMVLFGILGCRFGSLPASLRGEMIAPLRQGTGISPSENDKGDHAFVCHTITRDNTKYIKNVLKEANIKACPKEKGNVEGTSSTDEPKNARKHYERAWEILGALDEDTKIRKEIPNASGNQYRMMEIPKHTPLWNYDKNRLVYTHVLKDVDSRIKVTRGFCTIEEYQKIMNGSPYYILWHDVMFCDKFSFVDSLEFA